MACKTQSTLVKMKRQYQLFLMLAPAIVLTLIFAYIPLAGWYMAFSNYQLGRNMFSAEWVGLKQFASFFDGTNSAGYAIRNTLAINLMSLFIGLTFSCAFAVLLNEVKNRFFKKLVQTSSFFPYFVSWVIAYMIFNTFLAVKSGVLNQVMTSAGLLKTGINFLGNPDYSWGTILFVNLWKTLGYDSVLFIAAMAGIDPEQYEAANIDGAKRWQKILYITIPGLAPTFVILLIMNSGWIFASNFEQFYLFCNSTNWEKMEVLDIYIYEFGLSNLNYSYSTAVGIIKTFASIIMFTIVNFTAKKINGRSLL